MAGNRTNGVLIPLLPLALGGAVIEGFMILIEFSEMSNRVSKESATNLLVTQITLLRLIAAGTALLKKSFLGIEKFSGYSKN